MRLGTGDWGLGEADNSGKAWLVGAGPGRADLITVRGLRALQAADVVIYDWLIGRELLDEARPDAELIFAGKRPDHHTLRQEEINRLLVERVGAGQQVVRLKGGDPFVFGRGGEEALALAVAGLSFEIVPGVSSALAVPAYAGIPVTQRNIATSFAVITGHEAAGKADSQTDWDALSRIPTLVVLMGVGQIASIAQALIAAGRNGQTPAIAISQGTTDQQRSVRSTLAGLPSAIEAGGIDSPAVIVIGDVAALHDCLNWFAPDGVSAGLVDDAPVAWGSNPRLVRETGCCGLRK